MADPARNAAISFSQDAFDPQARGVNGRRMAGQSLLQGFLRHADVEEFLILSTSSRDVARVRKLAEAEAGGESRRPVRGVMAHDGTALATVGTIFHPSPGFAHWLWRRMPLGQGAFSVCGVTHTMATKAMMDQLFQLVSTPIQPWDALICTSTAVRAAVDHQIGLALDYHAARFGQRPVFPAQLPVLPLGIDCAAFRPVGDEGAALRHKLGIGEGEVVAVVLSRLAASGKFDPLPLYLAMAGAARRVDRPLHLLLAGLFVDPEEEHMFRAAAARLMPSVRLHIHDAREHPARRAALAAADMFLFPIDNIQESFGLAPVEAMAAGLPVVVSDWDGMRDTVTEDAGFRVPVLAGRAEHSVAESLRYLTRTDSYAQYLNMAADLTAIDIPAMADRIAALATNPDLRGRMGAAGRARAQGHYDWSVIIPRMQELWGDLTARRRDALRSGSPDRFRGVSIPVAPPAMAMFAAYPTRQIAADATRWRLRSKSGIDIAGMVALRRYDRLKRMIEPESVLSSVAGLLADGMPRDSARIADALSMRRRRVERAILWLLKFGFVEEAGTDDAPADRAGSQPRE